MPHFAFLIIETKCGILILYENFSNNFSNGIGFPKK